MNLLNNLNLKTKRQGFGAGSFIFTLLFGIIFSASGYFALQTNQIDKNWIHQDGTITGEKSEISDSNTLYTPVVKYSVNGHDYTVSGNTYTSGHPHIGSALEIAYNPQKPEQAKVISGFGTNILLWSFPIIGIAVILFGLISLVLSLRRNGIIKKLLEKGDKISGVVTNIQTANKGFKVLVSAPDETGNTKTYVSDALVGLGGMAMFDFQTHPITVDVYIDLINPKNYYVDVTDLPSLTADRLKDIIQTYQKDQNP